MLNKWERREVINTSLTTVGYISDDHIYMHKNPSAIAHLPTRATLSWKTEMEKQCIKNRIVAIASYLFHFKGIFETNLTKNFAL